jgi:hypothetical protein
MLAMALARVMPPLLSHHRGRLWQVAVALDDGQARVLRVAGVRSGERAPEVNRVAAGRTQYSMAAAATEPSALPNMEKPIRHSLIMHGRTVVGGVPRGALKGAVASICSLLAGPI